MVTADIDQFEHGVAELDRLLVIDHLVGHHDVGRQRVLLLQFEQTLLGAPVRDEDGAEILERLAAGDVIVMVMAVDDDLIGSSVTALIASMHGFCPAQVGNGISGNDALRRHDEHRLMTAIAEDVDVVGALHFLGRNRWASAPWWPRPQRSKPQQ